MVAENQTVIGKTDDIMVTKTDKIMITDILNGEYPFNEDLSLLTLNEDGSIADGAGNSVNNPALAHYLFGDRAEMFTGEQIAKAYEMPAGNGPLSRIIGSRYAKPVAAGLILSGAVLGAIAVKDMFGLPYELPKIGADMHAGQSFNPDDCHCHYTSEYIMPDPATGLPDPAHTKLVGTCEGPWGPGYLFARV